MRANRLYVVIFFVAGLLVFVFQNCGEVGEVLITESSQTVSDSKQGLSLASESSPISGKVESSYDRQNNFYDFMVQDHCLQSGKLPNEEGCREKNQRRNVRISDPMSYHMHNRHLDSLKDCRLAHGTVAVNSYPTLGDSGIRSIVFFKDQGRKRDQCSQFKSTDPEFRSLSNMQKDFVSLRWMNSSYGYMYVTESNNALGYYVTPSECYRNRYSPYRYNTGGWINAPLTLPAKGQTSGLNYKAKLLTQFPLEQSCPPYSNIFTLWTRTTVNFKYSSGLTLDSVINIKFSNGEASGRKAPGPAEAYERTYFTDEFGVTRWELWKRSDSQSWIENDRGIRESAVKLKSHILDGSIPNGARACSMPYNFIGNQGDTDMYVYDYISNGTVIQQKWRDKVSGEVKTWILVSCSDWSHVHRATGTQGFKLDGANLIEYVDDRLRFFF